MPSGVCRTASQQPVYRSAARRHKLTLPKHVDPAAARATLNLGVLVVMAPISGTDSGGVTASGHIASSRKTPGRPCWWASHRQWCDQMARASIKALA
jgi:hypothetical protein